MSNNHSSFKSILPDEPVWVDDATGMAGLLETLLGEEVVAVDTESDSLYSYYEKVCLIQFSTAQVDYLVDPLNVDVSGLAAFFAGSRIQKVFHAAEYDFLSLQRDYGFVFANLFDTMIAARILGWSRYGLGSVLKEHFGLKLDKRFQRYNWGRRPLSQKALTYARLDTHFLLPLREIQLAQLKAQNRLREAQEAFERETQVEATPKVFEARDFWRIKRARELEPQQQAILRELFILRDKIARRIDRPPFKVMNDHVLVELAREQPRHNRALKQIKGLGKRLAHYEGDEILRAIQAGQKASPPRYHSNSQRHDEKTMDRYETLRHWRNSLAADRGVEPDVIVGNQTLMDIARRNPHSLRSLDSMDLLGDWQMETYGPALLKVLREVR